MSNSVLDMVILHYALRERKYMMDLSKAVKADYFDAKYRLFFANLHGAFLNPNIKEVLSLPTFLEYCSDRLKSDTKIEILKHFEKIYRSALELKLDGKEYPGTDFPFFLQKFKERYNAMVLESSAHTLLNSIKEQQDIQQLNKIVSDTVREISSINKARVFDEGSLGDDIINIYKEYYSIRERPETFMGISSGMPSLDIITKGWHGGELIIIAGFEGSGKSLLSMQFAVNAWLGSNTMDTLPSNYVMDGKNVVYFSLEMPRSNRGEATMGAYLNKRMTSCISGVEFSSLRDGSLSDEDLVKFKKACKFIKDYDKHKKLYVVDIPRGATVEDIETKIIEISEEFKIDLVIVDYIGLMKGGEDESDWEAQGNIAGGLHELARIYNIPFISPVQVNRPQGTNHSLNKQNYNTTRIARGSGISQNANIVMQIGQRDNEYVYDDMPIYIIKARDGARGELSLRKDFSRMRVYDSQAVGDDTDGISDFIGLGEYNESSDDSHS